MITSEQRNALYEEIYVRLSGIDAVFRAAEQKDFEGAQSLGREFSEVLQMVLDDLGWGESTHVQDVVLTTSPDVLRRVLDRLRRSAADQLETEEKRTEEAREGEDHCRLVVSTCEGVIKAIDSGEPCCG